MSAFSFPCPACGKEISADSTQTGAQVTCPLCQAGITVPETGAPLSTAVATEAGVPPSPPEQHGTSAQRTSRLAIASLICSVSSLVTCVGWLPGIICGHLAKSRIRRDSSLKGGGLASAGLAIGYAILLLEVATAGIKVWQISAAVKEGFNNAKQELATNSLIVTRTQGTTVNPPAESGTPAPVPAESSHPASSAVEWTSDIANASIPEHPVSGNLHGIEFTFRTALLKGGTLLIRGPNGMTVEVMRLGDSAAGQNVTIQPGDSDKANPHVRMTWNDGSGTMTASYNQGYGMKLELDSGNGKVAAGKIYLCFPDDAKSCIAGTFKARLPKQQQ